MTVKAIVLDFDGVIVESEDIKDQAFRELFEDYPRHLDAIMMYHLSHKTVSRYDKFAHIVTNVLGEPYDADRARELDAAFSPLVRQRIISCPEVEGAQEFLEYFSPRVPLFVASATPQGELEAIIAGRGLGGYFKAVYGTPLTKGEILSRVMNIERLGPDELVYIGDTRNDFEAARQSGVVFVGRTRKEPFDGLDVPAFRGLNGIRDYLQPLLGGAEKDIWKR